MIFSASFFCLQILFLSFEKAFCVSAGARVCVRIHTSCRSPGASNPHFGVFQGTTLLLTLCQIVWFLWLFSFLLCCVSASFLLASKLLSTLSPPLPPSFSRLLIHSLARCVYIRRTQTALTHRNVLLSLVVAAMERSVRITVILRFAALRQSYTLARMNGIFSTNAQMCSSSDVCSTIAWFSMAMVLSMCVVSCEWALSVFVCYLLWLLWMTTTTTATEDACTGHGGAYGVHCARRKTKIKKQRAHYGFESLSAECEMRRSENARLTQYGPLPYCLVLCSLSVCVCMRRCVRMYISDCVCAWSNAIAVVRNHAECRNSAFAVMHNKIEPNFSPTRNGTNKIAQSFCVCLCAWQLSSCIYAVKWLCD